MSRTSSLAFAVVFALAYASWIVGSYANLAVVTPADQAKFGVSWSLKLTNEGGFIVALIVGLIIANFFPRLADWLKEAIRPELYIKIAIVILGAFIAVTAAGKLNLASSLLLRGVAAIVEAYLIYWSVVYFIARKWFGFSREWAAPLASGISICGVAAAIATGGAIRARPQVPVLVSSLVVIFAVIEVLILPFVAQTFLSHEPLVAAAWLGLAVKTDGAAVAAGGITDSLILAKAAAEGINYQPGWILGDHGDGESLHRRVHRRLGLHPRLYLDQPRQCRRGRREGQGLGNLGALPEIHPRLPRDFRDRTGAGAARDASSAPKLTAAIGEANMFRVIFFILTFFSIGVLSNFRKFWEDGLGKLAAVYLVSLFGFVIWVGLRFPGCSSPASNRRSSAEEGSRKKCRQEKLKAEITNAVEPLLPIEKKLIGWSFGTGLVLLAVLLLLSHYFPVS